MLFQTLHYTNVPPLGNRNLLVRPLPLSTPYIGSRIHIFYGSWNVNYVPLLVGVALLAWGLARIFINPFFKCTTMVIWSCNIFAILTFVRVQVLGLGNGTIVVLCAQIGLHLTPPMP